MRYYVPYSANAPSLSVSRDNVHNFNFDWSRRALPSPPAHGFYRHHSRVEDCQLISTQHNSTIQHYSCSSLAQPLVVGQPTRSTPVLENDQTSEDRDAEDVEEHTLTIVDLLNHAERLIRHVESRNGIRNSTSSDDDHSTNLPSTSRLTTELKASIRACRQLLIEKTGQLTENLVREASL